MRGVRFSRAPVQRALTRVPWVDSGAPWVDGGGLFGGGVMRRAFLARGHRGWGVGEWLLWGRRAGRGFFLATRYGGR